MSMTRLAKAMGVKRPTLLYHFPTRGHVLVAALEDLLTEQMRFVVGRIAEHEHPIDRVYARIRAIHEFHHGREEQTVFLSQAIAAAGGDRVGALIEVGNRVFEAQRQAQAAHIRQGIERGVVNRCDVDALMALVRSVTDGLLVQRVMTGLDLAPVHEFLWRSVLEPLKNKEEPTP